MTNFETNGSSGYISELSLQNCDDQPDTANFSQLNIDRLVFDENNQERPPFKLGLCCGSSCKFDRSLLVILIHHLIILMLVVFCITFLTVCETENRFASGILAILSACLGHILPAPKQWTSESVPTRIASFPLWALQDPEKRDWLDVWLSTWKTYFHPASQN